MQVNHAARADGGLFWRRPLVLGVSVAVLVVSTAVIIALLLFAGGADQPRSAPVGPQPSHTDMPVQQAPRAGQLVPE
jgi:hypothetical protein